MKIGILIPTYNRKQHLTQAIDSVLLQTHHDIELIIIDDSSTDGTREIVVRYSDPRIRYVYNVRNAGLIENINRGISMFSDDIQWCMVLCDDDLLEKDCLHRLVATIISTDAKSIIHTNLIFIDNQGKIIRAARPGPPEETAFDYITMRARFLRETYLTGALFNRAVFHEIDGYPPFVTGLTADDAFLFALALKDRLVFEQNAIAYIRIHEGAESVICSDGLNKIQSILQFQEYCKNLVYRGAGFDQDQIRQFENTLQLYVRALISGVWIASTHYVLHPQNYNYKQLVEHLSLVRDNPDLFTFRIKFAAMCHNICGFFPEAYESYRSLWKHYIYITRLISQLIKK